MKLKQTNNNYSTMMKLLSVSLILIFLIIPSAHAFDLEKKVVKTKLKNGLTVLMVERHVSPTVSLYIRHRVGAVDEEDGQTGAAHLLEHMMFKGTTTIGTKNFPQEKKLLAKINLVGQSLDKERLRGEKADNKKINSLAARLKKLQEEHKKYFIPNEIDRLYSENGGLDMNASTGQDVTTYSVSLPANKIELWARIEADRMINPVFREFYTERDVVLEERRQRYEAEPFGKLYEEFLAAAFQTHNYRRPVIGWEKDLRNLSVADINKYFQKYQSPQETVIAVVGAVNPQSTLQLIEKYFGGIAPVRSKPVFVKPEPPQTKLRQVNIEFEASPMLIMGFHKPAAPAYDDYVLDVLETILTKGRTSRLYNLLINELQLAESISAANGTPGTLHPNLFAFFARPRQPHTNEELQSVIEKEIARLKNEPVSAAELAKAKNHLQTGFIKSLDSNAEIASTLSYYEVLLGDYKYFSRYLETIERVSAADIQKAVQQYFNSSNMTIATLVKKKK